MEISFKTKMLRGLCEEESHASATLGSGAAEALKSRLADIRAADSIHEVLAGKPQSGTFEGKDCYRFEIGENQYLIVISNHPKPRNDADGTTAWEIVRRVKVVFLE